MLSGLTEQLNWPDGRGYTPCTPEYYELVRQKEIIFCSFGVGLCGCGEQAIERVAVENLPPEHFEIYHDLNEQLAALRRRGHLGTPFRYGSTNG